MNSDMKKPFDFLEKKPFVEFYTSSEEEPSPLQRKTEERKPKNWILKEKFKTTESAEKYVAGLEKWSFHYSNYTEAGLKRVFRCNKVKYRGTQCNAAIMLHYISDSNEVWLFETKAPHNCFIIQSKATKVDETTKSKIKELYSMGLKAKSILEHLASNKLEVLTKSQINNVIQSFKKEKFGYSVLSLGELESWLVNHSSVPTKDSDPFVVNYEINTEEKLFRFFISSKKLLQLALERDIIHCDATYKILWQGFPVLAVGTSDFDRHFHVFGICVCHNEQTEDFEFLFNSMKTAINNIFKYAYAPQILVSDAAQSIHSAFKNVYGSENMIIMCWAHMRRNVDKKIAKYIAKEDRIPIMKDIELLQLSNSIDCFYNALEVFVEKWSHYEEFLSYFYNEWIEKNTYWFEGAAIRVPSTNNCLESWNRRLKDDRTHRQRLSLSQFLYNSFDWVKTWSTSYGVGLNNFAGEPSITLNLWAKAYEWLRSKKKVEQPLLENGFWLHKIPPNDKTAIENRKEKNKWKTFAEYEKSFSTYWVVQISENINWINGKCDCPDFFKKYVCEHLVAIAVLLKKTNIPLEAKNIPIGCKPKRGRPSKAKKALIVQ